MAARVDSGACRIPAGHSFFFVFLLASSTHQTSRALPQTYAAGNEAESGMTRSAELRIHHRAGLLKRTLCVAESFRGRRECITQPTGLAIKAFSRAAIIHGRCLSSARPVWRGWREYEASIMTSRTD